MMAKARAGVMACEGQECESHEIGAPVVVFGNEKGTLSYACHWCGRTPYARPGTGQYAEWVRAMKKSEAAGAAHKGAGQSLNEKLQAPVKAGAGLIVG